MATVFNGFIALNSLALGSDLWLLASGTGLGPFLSIMSDPIAWRSFETVVLVHSVRYANEENARSSGLTLEIFTSFPTISKLIRSPALSLSAFRMLVGTVA
jgi:hypothetical protein